MSTALFGQVRYYAGSKEGFKRQYPEVSFKPEKMEELISDSPKIPDNLSPDVDGIPNSINKKYSKPSGIRNWTIKITAAGASSLSVHFSNFTLAPEAVMYIFNEDKNTILGPIASENSKHPRGRFGTGKFSGNVVYVQVLEGETGASSFTISGVTHGLFSENSQSTSKGRIAAVNSTSCIPDVKCINGWENEAEMVGRISTAWKGGTGTFMNNEAMDRRPFLLTAFHVLDQNSDDVIDAGEKAGLDSMILRVDVRHRSCNSVNEEFGYEMIGATYRSGWKSSDFGLIEMYETPPITALVNYAGWNKSSSVPSQGISLHHPHGEFLRYTASNNVIIAPIATSVKLIIN